MVSLRGAFFVNDHSTRCQITAAPITKITKGSVDSAIADFLADHARTGDSVLSPNDGHTQCRSRLSGFGIIRHGGIDHDSLGISTSRPACARLLGCAAARPVPLALALRPLRAQLVRSRPGLQSRNAIELRCGSPLNSPTLSRWMRSSRAPKCAVR
jgi:hypothetical protein